MKNTFMTPSAQQFGHGFNLIEMWRHRQNGGRDYNGESQVPFHCVLEFFFILVENAIISIQHESTVHSNEYKIDCVWKQI